MIADNIGAICHRPFYRTQTTDINPSFLPAEYDQAAKVPEPITVTVYWGYSNTLGSPTRYFTGMGPGHNAIRVKAIAWITNHRTRVRPVCRLDCVDVLDQIEYLSATEVIRFKRAIEAAVQIATGYEVLQFETDIMDGVTYHQRPSRPGRRE